MNTPAALAWSRRLKAEAEAKRKREERHAVLCECIAGVVLASLFALFTELAVAALLAAVTWLLVA